MMRFPITDLLDEADCYQYLLQVLHLGHVTVAFLRRLLRPAFTGLPI